MFKNLTTDSFIQKIAVLYVIVWSIAPPLQIDMIYRLLGLGCVGIWFLIELKHGISLEREQILALLFAFLVFVIAYIERGSLSETLKQIHLYLLVICFVMNYLYTGRWQELKGIVPFVLILLIIFNMKTWQVVSEDPTIARRLVRADETVYSYLRQGVGGYSLIYPQVCVFPAILAWIMKAFRKNIMCFIIGVIWLVSYVLCLLNAGYSIAIFTSAVGTIMLLFYKGSSAMSAFLVSAVILAAVMGSLLYMDGFRNFLLEFFDGTAIAKKINDLLLSAEAGAAEGSISARMIAYEGSINAILQYPVIGGLWMRSGGGHSAILDIFAKYGIWGGYIFAKMLYHVPNDYKSRIDYPQICFLSNAVLVSILFVSILDSFNYSFMCMILLVLPLLYEDIINWEEIEA